MKFLSTVLISGYLMMSCFSGGKSNEPLEPISDPKSATLKKKNESRLESDPEALVSDSCNPTPHEDPPFFMEEGGYMITRLLKRCTTNEGESGFMPNTSWMAMGFPCSGGNGYLTYEGRNYLNPRMISFPLETSCPMAPGSKQELIKISEGFGLGSNAKLMAFTPFVAQYWEVPGFTDADTGYVVELRSIEARDMIWKKLRKKEKVRIHLYGRENSWMPGNTFYRIDADIKLTGNQTFQMEVFHAKNLSEDEKSEVKTRCESLRPRRDCSRVF